MTKKFAEINARIAEWMGYTDVTVNALEGRGCPPDQYGAYGIAPYGKIKWVVPEYSQHMDCMHEVLKAVDNTDFMNQFITIIEDKLRLLTFSYEPRQTKDDWAILTADPAIYAEVFLETLDKMGERKV